jgi:hypothetical protein
MLSIIGLSLDIIGAVSLVLGLFGHMQPSTFGGPVRSVEDAAHDAAFGLVGAPLLMAGFVLQSFNYLNVRIAASLTTRLYVGGTTIVAASLVAFLVYGLIYRVVLRAEERYYAQAMSGTEWNPPPRRFRRLRFWLR